MREASAFAPAHVSGLFAVHDKDADPMRRGSRGAGWSLDRGAHATVRHADKTTIQVEHAGRHGAVTHAAATDTTVTRAALDRMAPGEGLEVTLRLDLPVGQGFGMSAAGTLAACLAATSLLGRDPEDALAAAHVAEVEHATGLGDVVGSWFGAGELRLRPGCPPHGWAMRVEPPEDARFLFCTLGAEVPTAPIIKDPDLARATRALGDAAVDRILDQGRDGAWRRILIESAVFSHRLGLMPVAMARLGSRLPHGLSWGQCMLGSTLWVAGTRGDLERAAAVVEGQGTVLHCGVDRHGARQVRRLA